MADTATKHVDFDDDAGSTDGLIEDGAKRVEVLLDPSNPHRRKSSLVESESQRAKLLGPECIVHQFFDQQQRRISHDAAAGSVYHHETASAAAPSIAQRQGEVADAAVTKTASELDLSHHTHGTEYQSRTLSKKQLSDMAWGVRELSRRLSSMRMRIHVKTIFVLTKIYDQELIPKTRELTRWLLDNDRETHYTVYVQDKLRGHKRFDAEGLIAEASQGYGEGGAEQVRKRLRYWDEEMCASRPHTFDFVITLGGDGTVLYASWLFQRVVPPVLSFALGSLGFLTQLEFDDFAPTLNSALIKGVTVSLRLRFEGTVMRSQKRVSGGAAEVDEDEHAQRDLVEELVGEGKDDGTTHKPDGTFNILNEIVVDRGPNPTMSSTELFGDDHHFTSILADGICVSTPTGSTAYNLGAGGSLCHPENPVMLVTSVCAHTLSFRPIILPDTIVLRIGVPYDARNASWASFDGRERVELRPGDYVTISASRYPFAVVQADGRQNEDWVTSISGKLGWNTREKQKGGFKKWESVPFFPEEDSKLRATSLTTRRGGNCPNSLQVLQQLLPLSSSADDVQLHLVTNLPSRSSPDTHRIESSFAPRPRVNLSHSLYREDHATAASAYIIRSEATGTRTLMNHSALPEMSLPEFEGIVDSFRGDETWWHFEGRIPETTIQCIRHLRAVLPSASVSIEIEKPGREGLTTLAAEADVVFYSRTWAEDRGYDSPEACLKGEQHPRARLALCTWGSEGAAAVSRSSDECFRWPVIRRADETITVVDFTYDGEVRGERERHSRSYVGESEQAGAPMSLSCLGEAASPRCAMRQQQTGGASVPYGIREGASTGWRNMADMQRRSAVGAGDTFIAGTLYGLLCRDGIKKTPSEHRDEHWDDQRKLSFAVALATLKVQQEGFDGLGAAAASIIAHQQ